MSKLCRAPGRRCPSRAQVGYDAGTTWVLGVPRLGEPVISPQDHQGVAPEPKAFAQVELRLSAFPQPLSRARWEDVAQWGVIWERERDGGKRRFVLDFGRYGKIYSHKVISAPLVSPCFPRKPSLARGAEQGERGHQTRENALSRAISRRQVWRLDVPPGGDRPCKYLILPKRMVGAAGIETRAAVSKSASFRALMLFEAGVRVECKRSRRSPA